MFQIKCIPINCDIHRQFIYIEMECLWYLGHVNAEPTKVYAYADTEMKRAAIQKGEKVRGAIPNVEPLWKNNDKMLCEFC